MLTTEIYDDDKKSLFGVLSMCFERNRKTCLFKTLC